MQIDPQAAAMLLESQLAPWRAAIADPGKAQEVVLHNLLNDYAKTGYGREHGAAQIGSLADYRQRFPVVSYTEMQPIIQKVMQGEVEALLWEQPVGWAITRGTTKGESKFIPMTATDLRMRVSAGRAMLNYVAETKRFDLFAGVNLNLNFPSVVGTLKAGEREIEYGYSSGIYTRHVSTFTPIRSAPTAGRDRCTGRRKIRQRLGKALRAGIPDLQRPECHAGGWRRAYCAALCPLPA